MLKVLLGSSLSKTNFWIHCVLRPFTILCTPFYYLTDFLVSRPDHQASRPCVHIHEPFTLTSHSRTRLTTISIQNNNVHILIFCVPRTVHFWRNTVVDWLEQPRATERESPSLTTSRSESTQSSRWFQQTGLAPWQFEFPLPGSLTSTFLEPRENWTSSWRWPSSREKYFYPESGNQNYNTIESTSNSRAFV